MILRSAFFLMNPVGWTTHDLWGEKIKLTCRTNPGRKEEFPRNYYYRRISNASGEPVHHCTFHH